MKIAIHHHARYDYEEPASFSPHLVRLFPRHDRHVRVERAALLAEGAADVQYRHDLFDNEIASCFYTDKSDHLEFRLELEIELVERNPFHFLLESHALCVPFDYLPREAAVLAPYLGDGPPLALPAGLMPPTARRPTLEVLLSLNQWIFATLGYERREEGPARMPAETLAAGAGACRDFAVLLVAALHGHGLAARLASGYLWEPPETAKEVRRAESALHAWVETYLPGAGWVGLDPTNGVFCDHHRIPAAVGLNADDISPIKGHYYGHKKIESRMTASLEITPR